MADFLKNSRVCLAVVIILSAFLFFFGLGDRSFRNPDEGRYAEIAREMLISGNWIEPTLYGVHYQSKPPLFYWLVALSFKTFGFHETAARIVPALFGFLGVLGTYFFARRYFGDKTAFFSALILATNPWYLQVSRYLIIDTVFAFFLVGALFAYYAFLREDRYSLLLLFYMFSALAFLSKGIAGAAIPLLVLCVYFAILHHWREGILRSISPLGFLIFLVIASPWFFLLTVRHPQFLQNFLFHEHFSRFLSSSYEHQEPWYFYFALLPLIFLPWSLFAKTIRNAFTADRSIKDDRRLFIWVLIFVTLVFFSLSRSKLATYLLPVIPPMALLLGEAWARWVTVKPDFPRQGRSGILTFLLVAALIFSGTVVMLSPVLGFKFPHQIPPPLRPIVFWGLWVVLLGLAIALWNFYKNKRSVVFFTLVVCLSVGSVGTAKAMEGLNAYYTTKHFAAYLKPRLSASDGVSIYDAPGAFYDFAFYLNHPVTVVGLQGEFERKVPQPGASMSPKEWAEKVGQERRFTLMRISDYEGLDEKTKKALSVLMQDPRKVLVFSQPRLQGEAR